MINDKCLFHIIKMGMIEQKKKKMCIECAGMEREYEAGSLSSPFPSKFTKMSLIE